jgi:hypothetical protein
MARRANPMHFTHGYNLPVVACGEAANRKRRTSAPGDVRKDENPCGACLRIVGLKAPAHAETP